MRPVTLERQPKEQKGFEGTSWCRAVKENETKEKGKVNAIPFHFPSLSLYKPDMSGFRLWKKNVEKTHFGYGQEDVRARNVV